MTSIKNIRFSFPYQENISNMFPCDQRKLCNSCSRTITDFRNKSKEILPEMKREQGTVCGIFSAKQVAKGCENYYQLAATAVLTIGLSLLSPHANTQQEIDPFKIRTATSQKDTTQQEEHIRAGVVIIDDEYPDYPGGISAIRNFLKENIVSPSDSVEGRVTVSFGVDTTGKVQNIRIKKSLSPLADTEVIRVVQLMHFIPPKRNGKPVPSRMSLPIIFRYERKE